jgi:chromosome segregation ATPase
VTFAALSIEQVSTITAGLVLGIATAWAAIKGHRADQKVEARTKVVDSALKNVEDATANANDTARSAARTAEEAKRRTEEFEQMRILVATASSSNTDLREQLRDIRHDLNACLKRDESNRAELILMRQEKVESDHRIHDLERELTAFAGQVAQLTAALNKET